jgi:5-methylcytosine-specific restriction enzyme subunit McrC
MRLQPDIVLKAGSTTVVIDTKWKLPGDRLPSPSDLRQVFAYNLYYNSTKAVLLYPGNTDRLGRSGTFLPTATIPDHEHGCQIRYATLNDAEGHLSSAFAPALLNELLPINTGNQGA